MIKSKAVDIIKALSPDEFKEFGKFVRSPYFNENGKVIELYGLLKKYYPDYSNRNFTKENLYEKLFAGKKYNDGTMRKLLSEIQTLAAEYLAHSNFDKKWYFRKNLALLEELDIKKLDNLFGMNLKQLDNVYKKYENFEDDYFKANFEIEVARINFNIGRDTAKPNQIKEDLIRCATYLICHSMIITLKLNHDILVTALKLDFDYKDTIAYKFIEIIGPEKFLIALQKYAPEFSQVLEIYFNRFMIAANLDEDDKYYERLKDLVLKNLEKFSRFEKYNLLLFLENSCAEKNHSGRDFRRELNDVYRRMLSVGIFSSDDKEYFSPIRFKNIITNGLSVNEIKWTEEFINDYLERLPPELKDNMLYFGHSLLDFKTGKYDKALENISKVKFSDYTMKFDSWALKLKTEFQLNYYEEALYSVDSYRHSLKNDTTSPQWLKTRFLNFMHIYQKVFKMKYEGNKLSETETEFLRDEISSTKELLEKEWLLEKIV